MKKKWLIGSIVGLVVVVLGGAYGVHAVSGDDNWSKEEVKVSQEEAKSVAEQEVDGLAINHVEKEEDDGRLLYEFDGQLDNGEEVDIDIDANTGEVVKVDRESDEDVSNKEASKDLKVTEEEAEKVAKEKAPNGKVVEMEVDDGVYEFELNDGDNEYEVTVHGQSGEVIEFEKE
ncbi:Peptidase propeptide and YPEB domain-containing protein [Halobacillus dabanensis]|uniref:Peptidase propeptide and YPEB domain-containing protein n=1 Tax=Halobacillus dabanensis TaxID=240302 RepID=A0A1I3RNE6_HALDA|nr:PepSY domain-containing protein [Halobacillus dabanensis]SFJ46821.1 Peptidase propeptide and YPEB domain-containing protein [Halobacillus dabanensis]